MKRTGRPEAHETLAMGTGEQIRASEFSIPDFRNRDLDSPTSASMRCWQPGEVEVENPWGVGSISSRSEGWVPHDRFEVLKKSKSKQLHGSRRLHRAGRRVFSCFRHSTINLVVREKEPSTPPKSGPLSAPRISVGGAHGGTFMDDAMDHHTDKNKDLNAEEPTSPVVNCMGQVRRSNKMKKHPKKTEPPKAVNDMDIFRRTKSQAPIASPSRVSRSMSCKWKQLLRSNSSSISPSNHPLCDGEFQIDLCRFSSASGSSDPFYRDVVTEKKPDKTCLLMRRSNSASQAIPAKTDETHKLFQEQLDARNVEGGDHRKTAVESQLVFRNLPKLKTKSIESPKWLADEPALNRRHGLYKPSKMDLKSSSTPMRNS